jgi:hypothetical protein
MSKSQPTSKKKLDNLITDPLRKEVAALVKADIATNITHSYKNEINFYDNANERPYSFLVRSPPNKNAHVKFKSIHVLGDSRQINRLRDIYEPPNYNIVEKEVHRDI